MIENIITVLILFLLSPVLFAKDVCSNLRDIHVIPIKNERVDDRAYNSIIEQGILALPCLIREVTNTERMSDPRKAPKFNNVTIGDVAYFLIGDISGLEFIEPLPNEVKEKYKTDGVYAYFTFVENVKNRRILKTYLVEWHKSITKQIQPTPKNGSADL